MYPAGDTVRVDALQPHLPKVLLVSEPIRAHGTGVVHVLSVHAEMTHMCIAGARADRCAGGCARLQFSVTTLPLCHHHVKQRFIRDVRMCM